MGGYPWLLHPDSAEALAALRRTLLQVVARLQVLS
jgi:hypothetical protein